MFEGVKEGAEIGGFKNDVHKLDILHVVCTQHY